MKTLTTTLALAAFFAVASCSAWASPPGVHVAVNAIPEPASLAAFIAGIAVLGIARRRRASCTG